MIYIRNFSLIFIIQFCSLYAHASDQWGWKVEIEGQNDICYSEVLNSHVSFKHTNKSLANEYKSNPLLFPMHWKIRTSLFTSDVVPFNQVNSLHLSSVRSNKIRELEVITVDGSELDGDDNMGYLYSCKSGDEKYFDRCIPIYYLEVNCLDLNEGITIRKHLKFDHNRNGIKPSSKVYEFKSIQRVNFTEVASILDKFNESSAKRPAEQLANSAQRKAEMNALIAQQEANAKRIARQNNEILTKSPIKTSMFCDSGDLLLMAGESITKLHYKCDLLTESMKLRDLLNYGWEIVREKRTPTQTIFDNTGYIVSLELRKFK